MTDAETPDETEPESEPLDPHAPELGAADDLDLPDLEDLDADLESEPTTDAQLDVHRQTRSHLMKVLGQRKWHPRHDLGQNFLIDINLIEFIVRSAELTRQDVVLEVGTGSGGMTAFLAEQAGRVVSIEIDFRMFELAGKATSRFDNVRLRNIDALHNKNRLADELLADVRAALAEIPNARLKLVANLPYCVATPVISNLIATDLPWEKMVVTVQYEMAERMAAQPGTEHYSGLAVWLQAQTDVRILKKLGPTVFWPRPKVDSAVVQVDRVPERQATIGDRAAFQDFVRTLFTQRRKSLRTVLAGMYKNRLDRPALDKILGDLGIEEGIRAERLPPATLARLAATIVPPAATADPLTK
jgi:16S rRNA (adenine1518-N6/adenine1519-N6)-dimethyltransferase